MSTPASVSGYQPINSPQGFVISVGLTEEEARRAGTSLERIIHAMQVQLAAMLPAAQTRVALLPAPPTAASGRPKLRALRRPPESGLLLDLARGQARIDGQDISLSQREYELLSVLAAKHGKPLTRSELYRRVWSSDSGAASNERVVDVTVRRLRTRLRGYAQIIRTVRGTGYRFDLQPGVTIREPQPGGVGTRR